MALSLRAMRRASRTAVAAATVAALIAGSDVAFAAVDYLSGAGPQPEDVLPASVVAVAKVDFDPSLDQKLALFQLSKKLPVDSTRTSTEDSLKDDILGSLFAEFGRNYARDIKPWIGDRAAVAAIPDSTEEFGFATVIAVQYKNRAAANLSMNRLRAAAARHPDGMQLQYALKGGYVLIAQTAERVKSVAAATSYLVDRPGYSWATGHLGGNQLGTAWVDLGAAYGATPREYRPMIAGSIRTAPKGFYVTGMHADPTYLEVRGMAIGTTAATNDALNGGLGKTPGVNMLATYPSDTFAGFDAVGLGDLVARTYTEFAGEDDAELEAEFGLKLPEDLRSVLGEETGVGVFGSKPGEMEVVGRSKTVNPRRAYVIAQKLLIKSGVAPTLARRQLKLISNGVLAGTSQPAVTKAASGLRPLGQTASFQKAVPDAAGAGVTSYVNIAGMIRQLEVFERGDPEAARYRYLDAFGFTITPGTGAFRARLTVK